MARELIDDRLNFGFFSDPVHRQLDILFALSLRNIRHNVSCFGHKCFSLSLSLGFHQHLLTMQAPESSQPKPKLRVWWGRRSPERAAFRPLNSSTEPSTREMLQRS